MLNDNTDFQALKNDAYDHYTAIYYLLLERLRQHRNVTAATQTPANVQQDPNVATSSVSGANRRPSTIAEQALTHKANTGTSPAARPDLYSVKQGAFSQTTDCVSPPTPLNATMSASQQQLWNDIESIQGIDSIRSVYGHNTTPPPPGDIPASAYGSKGRVQHCSSSSSTGGVPGGQVVTGGGVISTSIDEGVEVDFSESDLCSNTSVFSLTSQGSSGQQSSPLTQHNITQQQRSSVDNSQSSSLTRSSMFTDLSQLSSLDMSNQSISTGTGSAFTSFDSNIEADLMSSLSSCTQPSFPSCSYSASPTQRNQNPVSVTMTPPIVSKFGHHRAVRMCGAGDGKKTTSSSSGDQSSDDERFLTQSPVSFREGRRASDGLMSQHVIAFRQRLKENMKTRGVAEIRKEMENLQTRFQNHLPEGQLRRLQEQHQAYQEMSLKQRSLEENLQPLERPKLHTKRMSLPGQMDLVPHKILALKQSRQLERQFEPLSNSPSPVGGGVVGYSEGSPAAGGVVAPTGGAPGGSVSGKPPLGTPPYPSLHKQLGLHRLQQKRQQFQKHGQSFSVTNQMYRQFQQMNLEQGEGSQATAQINTGNCYIILCFK